MPNEPELILVPVDLEPASLGALSVARRLAAKLDHEIVLVHVLVYPPTHLTLPELAPGLEAATAIAAQRAIEAIAEGERILTYVGDPADEILDAIREIRPRLVVMGTHGRRGIGRALLGSVAEQVMRRSPVPIITVRPPAERTDVAEGARA